MGSFSATIEWRSPGTFLLPPAQPALCPSALQVHREVVVQGSNTRLSSLVVSGGWGGLIRGSTGGVGGRHRFMPFCFLIPISLSSADAASLHGPSSCPQRPPLHAALATLCGHRALPSALQAWAGDILHLAVPEDFSISACCPEPADTVQIAPPFNVPWRELSVCCWNPAWY